MVQINFAKREVQCKVVYYGPACSGKTSNLRMIHENAPPRVRGTLTSIATDAERTLFFDFLPLDLGDVAGLRTKVHLYAVPWLDRHNAVRILVLEGVDGVVFVADSSRSRLRDNLAAMENLRENLAQLGRGLDELPLVFQWNRSDAGDAMPEDELARELAADGHRSVAAVASLGTGVFPTLKAITQGVLENVVSVMRVSAGAARIAAGGAPEPVEGAGEPVEAVPEPVGAPVLAHAETVEAHEAVEGPVAAHVGTVAARGFVPLAPTPVPAGSRTDDFHSVDDLPRLDEADETDSAPVRRARWHTRAPVAAAAPADGRAEAPPEPPAAAPRREAPAAEEPPPSSDPGRSVLVGPPKVVRRPRAAAAPAPPPSSTEWDDRRAAAPAARRTSRVAAERDARPVTDRRKTPRRVQTVPLQTPRASLVAGSLIAFVALATIGYLVFALL